MQWLITYTSDYDVTRNQLIIAAATYTAAYLLFTLCNDSIVLEITKI